MSSIGPQIPDNLTTSARPDSEEDDDDDFMPQLPPDLLAAANSNNDERFIDKDDDDDNDGEKKPDDDDDDESSDDDDDVIGPLPPTAEDERRAKMSVAQEIESRNKNMKDKLTGKQEKAPERETWMTELPDLVRKNFGLVARGFRKDAGPTAEGRTEWTETPADKEKRRLEAIERGSKRGGDGGDGGDIDDDDDDDDKGSKKKKKSKSKKHKREKDREEKIRKGVEKYNEEKRGESLMEIHRKKLEKKKEKERKKGKDKPAERVPFSREKDLEVNKFDDAKRNRLIKASAQLNTRFSHGGSTSSFL